MRYLFIFIFIPLFANDINFYLEKKNSRLWSYYHQVKKQSMLKKYPIFRQRNLIVQKSYQQLPQEEKKVFYNHLAFVAFYLRSRPVYSDFGGISIKGKLAEEINDLKAKDYFYLFDGRYYTDLMNVDLNKILYAYCRLPNFDSCVLLGIGEEW